MKQKTTVLIYCVLFILFLLGAGFLLWKSEAWKSGSSGQAHENTPPAGQTSDAFGSLVLTIEGTTPEMLSLSFWAREEDDKVLFSPGEISAFNRNNPPFVEYYSQDLGYNIKLYMYDLPESLSGEAVTELIGPKSVQRFSSGKQPYYINGALPDDGYWSALEERLGLDRIPETVCPLYAICVRRTVARIVPSGDFAAVDPDEAFFDRFISAEIMPFTGVVVLHESADGEWYYILSASFCGWVKKDTVAVCGDREEWLAACMPESFLLVTGSEIVLDETALPTVSSGMVLPMGTKIRLSSEASGLVNGRSSFGCYCAEIPCLAPDGSLAWEQALIPVSKDVHVGYLSMTSASVLEQAFKFLGRVYGYGGSLSSNDCSGFVRQVYGCYGFELPRNARAIAKLMDLGSIDCSEMTRGKKLSILAEMPSGLLLFMDDHIMFYLGMKDDIPYVLSSCATCIEPDHETSDIVPAYSVFVSSLDLRRASGKTWLDSLRYILWKEY